MFDSAKGSNQKNKNKNKNPRMKGHLVTGKLEGPGYIKRFLLHILIEQTPEKIFKVCGKEERK